MQRMILLIACITLFSSFQEDPPPVQKTAEAFATFARFPKEKVYLHTDKEVYRTGEEIWFRAYLLDATTNIPIILSRYIYVELMNQQDSVIRRLKIQEFDSVFHGSLTLPDSLPQGNYLLRAYTYWMQNEGTDHHFRKYIRIVNPQESRLNTRVTYTRNANGKLTAEIQVTNHLKEVVTDQTFLYEVDKRNKSGKTRSAKTNQEGVLRIPLDTDDYSIHLYFKKDFPFRLNRRLYIPPQHTDFDVQFFPEGGSLLSGNRQRIAFKAIGQDGLGLDVTGHIYIDSIIVATVQSEHKGMGSFTIPVYADKNYHAKIRTSNGLEKTFSLPQVDTVGWGLSLSAKDSILTYRVMRGEQAIPPRDLQLIIHSRGIPLAILPITTSQGKLHLLERPTGIAHAVLADTDGQVYSERLFFIPQRTRLPQLTITANKPYYDARERVDLTINPDFSVDTLLTSFSIAVVDSADSQAYTLADNIISNLLLTSDLKGHIEDPAYYFSDTSATITRHLELLMLTHGWSRFNVSDILKQRTPNKPYYLERGQALSGIVKNYKERYNAKLLLRSTRDFIGKEFAIDSNNRFYRDVAFVDGVRFSLGAIDLKLHQRSRLEIIFDQDKFLPAQNFFPWNSEIQDEEEQFYQQSHQNYFIENGEKVYILDEIKVTKRMPKKTYSPFDHWADDHERFDSAQIANMKGDHLVDIIKQLPDIMVIGDRIHPISDRNVDIPVFVNRFHETFRYLEYYPTHFLLSVARIRGSVAATIAMSIFDDSIKAKPYKHGIIMVTTTKNYKWNKPLPKHFVTIKPLGVTLPKEFYVPRYDVDSVRYRKERDLRSTLYWNPALSFQAGKENKISFYTNDRRGAYTIIIEGVTREGVPVRKTKQITLK